MNEKTNYPMVLVFYLDREMMKVAEIIQPFVESVNFMLEQKNSNTLAFFLPTDGEERIDCINPLTVNEADMAKINEMVEDIKKNFSVGVDTLNNEEIPTEKPCECGKNPNGTCKC